MSWIKLAGILTGGVLGAFFALLSIKFFHSDASRIGYLAACAIFGAIVCAIISAALPQRARTSGRSGLSKQSDAHGRPQDRRGKPTDSPPLSPE